MSWLGLLLVGIGVSDLVFSIRPMRFVPESVGAVVALALGVGMCGLHSGRDLVALLLVAVLVLAWGLTVTAGFRSGRAWLPLTVGGLGVLALLLVSGYATTPVDGAFARWVDSSPYAVLGSLRPEQALLLLGVLLVQLSTGNVVVRLVLLATGSRNPSRVLRRAAGGRAPDRGESDERPLKGGRLLGPMERLLIVGLALAGQVTAASIVIAAKGLLRFPELQAARAETRPGIHEVTEYFLVGSFVSWLLALGGVALVLS